MFLALMEWAFIFAGTWALATQVFWPLWTGRRLFPAFGPRAKAEEALARAREQKELQGLFEASREEQKPAEPKEGSHESQ